MAKGPMDVLARANSAWNQAVTVEEARIDKVLETSSRLPVRISLSNGLDCGQIGELVARYKKAGWKAWVEHVKGDSDDPRSNDYDCLILEVV